MLDGLPAVTIEDAGSLFPVSVSYASGSGTATLVFSIEMAGGEGRPDDFALTANSLRLRGARIVSQASGLAAELGHPGAAASTPGISVADTAATEGPTATADFVVTLDPAASEAVSVDYETGDGTAVAGEDYTNVTGTVIFAAGETTKTVSVRVLDDDVEDAGETFELVLSNPQGAHAYLARPRAVATVDNDDTGTAPLTAAFAEMPASHGGEAFSFELAFSEAFPVSYVTVRDHAVAVTGGAVAGAARVVQGDNQRWRITVEPEEGADDVSLTLPATTDCTAAGALCTEDGRPLSAAVSATVPREAPADAPVTPFTVSFEAVPAEHDGAARVTFRVVFNKRPDAGYSYRTMRDQTLAITQGGQSLDAAQAKRLNAPHNDRWEIAVDPVSKEDLTVAIEATVDCAAAGAVCTEGGEALSNAVSATIPGPPGLSVADARAEENTDEAVQFTVTLSRESTATITVDYATADGTAEAGADYTSTSGTLTFAAGETEKTVSVPILQDAHDEGDETLTLTLSNPSGGNAWLKDGEATGTIENDDPMPRAWLARFGRTVAEQAIAAVEGRFSASRAAGVEMTVAGQRIDWSGAAPENDHARAQPAGGQEPRSRSVAPLEVLSGSSFALSGEANDGGVVSLWGRGAVARFDGREDDLQLDGEVVSALFGADWTGGPGTVGLMVSRTMGEGGFRGPEAEGTVETTMTGLFPYGRYAAGDRVTLWGVAGWGVGDLALTPQGQPPMRTDTAVS